MARQYVTYEEVDKGLVRHGWSNIHESNCVVCYLRLLREETGLSWAKLAHDLSVDSGCKVSEANARRWAR